ncbi:acyl-CoA thioesterase [Candidatus Binatia bacterium]|nr:acyl-CoA thioesterase [Candidatus Binatia bacterium]
MKPQTAVSLPEVARYRVIFGDCDLMQAMYFAAYFRLLEIGRAELFRQIGHAFPDYIARGLFLAVVEANCRYLRSARYDDELILRAAITEVKRVTLTVTYAIDRADGVAIASASTLHAVLDAAGRPQRIPPGIYVTV